MYLIESIKKHWTIIPMYSLWTFAFVIFTYITTGYLENIEELDNALSLTNQLLESRIIWLGLSSLWIYGVYICIDRFVANFTKHKVKAGKHKVIDSIIKVTFIGAGSNISGVMYTLNFYLMINPHEPYSSGGVFWLITTFTIFMIILTFVCYWIMDYINLKFVIELP